MKTLILLIFTLFYMCIGENTDGVLTHQTYWYFVNRSSEVLYLYGRGGVVKLPLFMDAGRTEVYNVREYDSIRPYSEFYTVKTKPHDLYHEMVLLNSKKKVIRKWTIHDKDIDKRHIMHHEAWSSKLHDNGEISVLEWTYTITDDDLVVWRRNGERE